MASLLTAPSASWKEGVDNALKHFDEYRRVRGQPPLEASTEEELIDQQVYDTTYSGWQWPWRTRR
eukprot:7612052-Pyramimonas_sp.AAC.1